MSRKRKFIISIDKDIDEKTDSIGDGSIFRKHILQKKAGQSQLLSHEVIDKPIVNNPSTATTSECKALNESSIDIGKGDFTSSLSSQIEHQHDDAKPGPSSASDIDIETSKGKGKAASSNKFVGKTFAETFAFLKDAEYYKEIDLHHKEAKEVGKELGKASADNVQTTKAKSNSIIVNIRQRGNPILKHIRNIPWEFGDVIPDYVLGQTTCALYLSLRYHNFNPEYIHDRLKLLGNRFELRVLLLQIDVKDPHQSLKELTKICILADCTLILAWSTEEAGRYLETYKCYENKPADILKERIEGDYLSKMTDCLTSVKSVNKTDVVTLLSIFGSFKKIVSAPKEEMALCPGIGPQKANRLYKIFREPFIRRKKTVLQQEDEGSSKDKEG